MGIVENLSHNNFLVDKSKTFFVLQLMWFFNNFGNSFRINKPNATKHELTLNVLCILKNLT